MDLTLGDGTIIESPTTVQIREALAELDGGTDSFVVFSDGDASFIQTTGSATEGFVLEHWAAGGVLRRSADSALTLSAVAHAFERFASGVGDPLSGLAVDVDEGALGAPALRGRSRLWVTLALVPVVMGSLALLLSWAVATGRVSVRATFIGTGLVMAVLLVDGVWSGKLHGYSRETEHYWLYLAIYAVTAAVCTFGALAP